MSTEIATIAYDLLIAGVATRLSVAEAFRYAEAFVLERDFRAARASAVKTEAERDAVGAPRVMRTRKPTLAERVASPGFAEGVAAARVRLDAADDRVPYWYRAEDTGTWHRLRAGTSEAECGETIDGETTIEGTLARDPETTCSDCRDIETIETGGASAEQSLEYDPPGRIHPTSGPLIAAGPKIPASHSGAVARAEQAALDAAVTEVVEQEAAMPRWGRASTGAPYSSYTWHRWREGSSEAECGETCDGEIVYSEPEPESTCEDCRASETGEVQPEPELAARIAEDAEAGRKTAIEPPAKPPRKPRAPRVCCGPSCTAPGKTAKNASGAKVARSAYLCEAHMRFAETDPALVRAWAGQRAQTAIPGTTEAA